MGCAVSKIGRRRMVLTVSPSEQEEAEDPDLKCKRKHSIFVRWLLFSPKVWGVSGVGVLGGSGCRAQASLKLGGCRGRDQEC